MIPSPTKLALLIGIVLLIGEASAHPTRYDQRQDGELNFRADVEDVVLVAVPPKDYIANGLTWLGANFIRHNPNRIHTRTPSKHGFVQTEKSPYKVDLGKSSVPVMKLHSPVVEEVKLYAIRDAAEVPDQPKIVADAVGSKTVKKELKEDGNGTTPEAEPEPEPEPKPKPKPEKTTVTAATTPATAATKKTETKKSSGLQVVGVASEPTSNIREEDCGPMAHRNENGTCVYE